MLSSNPRNGYPNELRQRSIAGALALSQAHVVSRADRLVFGERLG